MPQKISPLTSVRFFLASFVLFHHSVRTFFPVFSGRGAPHISRVDEKIFHLMDPGKFKEEVLDLGGMPPGFFDHPELLELFLPLLKNDFKIAEEAEFENTAAPLDQAITVFLGKDEDLTPEQCDGWKRHSVRDLVS